MRPATCCWLPERARDRASVASPMAGRARPGGLQLGDRDAAMPREARRISRGLPGLVLNVP